MDWVDLGLREIEQGGGVGWIRIGTSGWLLTT